MKALPTKLIIRYRPEDLDQHLNKFGFIQIVNALNKPELVSETCVVVSSGDKEIPDNSEIVVQYLVAFDTSYNQDQLTSIKRNQYFISKEEDGSELRWCHKDQVFGVIKDGKIIPVNGYMFCEPPMKPYEYKGKIIIPDMYKKQDTDNKGYRAKIKYLNNKDKKELSLQEGMTIWAEKNTDATKKILGEELIRVPVNKVVAVEL